MQVRAGSPRVCSCRLLSSFHPLSPHLGCSPLNLSLTVSDPLLLLLLPPQVIFTRIDPSQGNTSMVIRPRPGWEELRAFLAGENDPTPVPGGRPKQRFEVYVCTAAERRWGSGRRPSGRRLLHDAWRALQDDVH